MIRVVRYTVHQECVHARGSFKWRKMLLLFAHALSLLSHSLSSYWLSDVQCCAVLGQIKMGRTPCCSKAGLLRGPWSVKEDKLLINYIQTNGEGHWRDMPKKAGLLRCGKSCRLRWMNYLRPDIKRGNITSDEEDLILRLHSLLGNRWSIIAKRLPGRTDNEIKNYWNSHLSKRIEKNPATKDQPKKRNQSKQMKKKQDRGNDEETTETKIYLPKAYRVSANSIKRNSSSLESRVSGSSSHGELGKTDSLMNIITSTAPCWSDPEGAKEAPVSEESCSRVNACGMSFLDFVHQEDCNILDTIFEEYQQLLNNTVNSWIPSPIPFWSDCS